jgi:ABC-type oligopeptide transport system ATPase subunit
MIKNLKNNQCFLKTVIFGDSGSGKTTLAEKLAIGLATNTRKVCIIDTEGGFAFFDKNFATAGIEAIDMNFADETDSTKRIDAVKIINKLLINAIEMKPDVIIIDSISDFGELYQHEFVNKKPAAQSIINWGIAKREWTLNIIEVLKKAPMHIIICGKEKSGIEITKNQENNKTNIEYTENTTVKSGLDITYALNLTIHMKIGIENGKRIRVADIIKDRTNQINDQIFTNPTFDNIKPHLQGLVPETDLYSQECIDLINKIKVCDNLNDLQIVANEIKLTTLPDNEIIILRQKYTVKHKILETALNKSE